MPHVYGCGVVPFLFLPSNNAKYMILYNITLNMDSDVAEACLDYLKHSYLPQATQSGVMHSPRIHKILPHDDASARSDSYAIHFNVEKVDTLNYWIEHEGQGISKQLVEHFGDKVAGFTTVLEEIDLSE